MANKMLTTRLPAAEEKLALQHLLRPDNIPELQTPRINQEIYTKLRQRTKDADTAVTKAHKKLNKCLSAITKIADGLQLLKSKVGKKQKAEIKTLTQTALNGLQAGVSAVQDLTQFRRDQVRIDLKPSCKKLTNTPKEENFQQELFGPDLLEKMKQIDASETLATKLVYGPSEGKKYAKPSSTFLGKAGRPEKTGTVRKRPPTPTPKTTEDRGGGKYHRYSGTTWRAPLLAS